MKLRFKLQSYQSAAVDSVVDCFDGQPNSGGFRYRIDPGRRVQARTLDDEGFRNDAIRLTDAELLKNVQEVQRRQNLIVSKSLQNFSRINTKGNSKNTPNSYKPGAHLNLDIEMETGTGKTYCYIKTIFEMNKRYGWSKFIVIVPSIAIREGVYKSFQITAEHFAQSYNKKARFFIYNSKRLHELESFSSDAGINVMIINIQAFFARGADNRRIYEELDDFQSRKPIDVIAANRPILILDEPQKMEGSQTLDALPKFNPLMILRYSATHRTNHLKVHRLDAVDAYNQKLVKKISVRGIHTHGLPGTNAYLYLEDIKLSKKAPVARIEMEVKLKPGRIKRERRLLKTGRDLFDVSGGLDQYRGFTIRPIDYNQNGIEFTNGKFLEKGQSSGDVMEKDIRRLQIRETIKVHLEKEKQLFSQGIKVLSLFFIDEVAKYRDYDQDDDKGEYARVFEQEYTDLKKEYLSELPIDNKEYREYLAAIEAADTHKGYFSIDRKTQRLKDPIVKKKGEDAGLSDDVDAYDLILKDKERLLSFKEDTRFIFSHSALREGWDNPNVFVMCMLKHSDNTISRRQEVGRGLRLSVDQQGERMDEPTIVHDINVLTVVASESYKDFVAGLQTEIVESLSARPRKATEEYFTGKILKTSAGQVTVTPQMATEIHRYLIRHEYIDNNDEITQTYHDAREVSGCAELPETLRPHADQIFELIDSVFDDSNLPQIDNDRDRKINPLNDNFYKKEFQELWSRINRKAIYQVDFESEEMVRKAIEALNGQLHVRSPQYKIEAGEQVEALTGTQLSEGKGFEKTHTSIEESGSIHSEVTYDLIGKIAENTNLTRKTVTEILKGIESPIFDQFKMNPEHFIAEASRLIEEQKGSVIIEHLHYNEIEERYEQNIFTDAQSGQNLSKAIGVLNKHIYDYCVTDSKQETEYVQEVDISDEVIVYGKLPNGFRIPTPVGEYNPDWAISFKREKVKHTYFIAETKGSMSTLHLRELEHSKIKCARKFFDSLQKRIDTDKVRYGVATNYEHLMEIVQGKQQDGS